MIFMTGRPAPHDGIRVGINRMVVTTPGLYIKPEEIAKPITRQDIDYKLKKEAKEARAAGREWREPASDEIERMVADKVAENVGKIRKGLGVETIRMAGYSESNATFVADGIYEFIMGVAGNGASFSKLINEPIRALYYGTESNPDRSRPELEVSLLVACSKLLDDDEPKYRPIVEMLKEARLVPITYACVGGVVGLHEAVTRVRQATSSGRSESALVIGADTAYYDSKKAPGAEATQGAAATIMWVTQNPDLVIVGEQTGNYRTAMSDFTKFIEETPEVHGKFSELAYVYTVSKALERLETELIGDQRHKASILNELDFFICHVPFPKQAEYFASFLFMHWMKLHDQQKFAEIQGRDGIGKEPLGSFRHLTDMMDSKMRSFNRNENRNEQEIIGYIESDQEIKTYWEWLKALRKTPEFEEFLNGLHIRDALKLPAQVGNSYSSSIFVSLASLIKYVFGEMPENGGAGSAGIMAGYGSGAQAMTYPINIVARKGTLDGKLALHMNDGIEYALTAEQYEELHAAHIKGDAVRLTANPDLVKKDQKLLKTDKLPKGFHVNRRNTDGTGEYVYSDGERITPVRIRY